MKIKNDFSKILNSYFTCHLQLERKFSANTYSTYLIVIKQYISYLNGNGIKSECVSINDFNKTNVLSFLNHIENDLKCSTKTRNHKLVILNSFLEYAQSINPIYLTNYLDVKSIKLKRITKEKMDFMTIKELETFFKAINLKYKSGYKHYVLFTILYETGVRVSELINIKIEDCYLTSDHPYIKILGKGFKERIVYINDNVVKMILEYTEKFNVKEGFLLRNHSNEQYTRFGINKTIDKYYEIAKKECPTLERKRITPHTFRHSKAVHFLQNGTALPIIQRFLGHSSIQTTEIYLDVTNDVVIEAVKLASNTISSDQIESKWEDNEDLMVMLENLKL